MLLKAQLHGSNFGAKITSCNCAFNETLVNYIVQLITCTCSMPFCNNTCMSSLYVVMVASACPRQLTGYHPYIKYTNHTIDSLIGHPGCHVIASYLMLAH